MKEKFRSWQPKGNLREYREIAKAIKAVDFHHKEAMKLLRSFMKRKNAEHNKWLSDARHKLCVARDKIGKAEV